MAELLVSVRDAGEVAAALAGGAALIDVKEPNHGALGRADDDVREGVIDAVAGRVPVSVALGELLGHGEPIGTSRVAYVKYGLAYAEGEDWRAILDAARSRVEAGRCRLVVTAYADCDLAF